MKRVAFLLFFCSVCACFTAAQFPFVRNFSRTDYLAGNQNWDIEQDSDKQMYFANNNGVLIYDSDNWRLYPIANHTNIRSLWLNPDNHRLYVGAFNELGYYEHDPQNKKYVYRSLLDYIPEQERNFSEIWKICQLDNDIFFQGDHKIFRFGPDNQVTIYSFDQKIEKSAVIHNTYIIANTTEGVWTLQQGMFFRLPQSDLLKGKKVAGILPFEGTKILFATALDGLFLFDGEKVSPYECDLNEFLRENQVFCAAAKGNRIAFGTVLKGSVVRNLQTQENTFINYINANVGLRNNTVLSLKFDSDNNLWLGLDKGIAYARINTPIQNILSTNNLYGTGYTSQVYGNRLYLGTNQGLYITSYPIRNSPEQLDIRLVPHMQGQVWSLQKIAGTLFCGNDRGAFVIKGENAHCLVPSGTWSFRPLRHHPDYILGSSYQGFFLLKKQGQDWAFSHFVKGFNEYGGMFEEGADGDIWFSHWMKGIYQLKWDSSLQSFRHIRQYTYHDGLPSNHNNVLNRFEGQLLLSTQQGTFRFDEQSNRFVPAPRLDSLLSPHHRSVHLHPVSDNEYWSTSGSSITRLTRKKNGSYQVDSLSFKFLIDKLNLGFEHLCVLDDHQLLLSTEDGFAHIDTDRKTISSQQPHVFIRSIATLTPRDSLLYVREGNEAADITLPDIPYANNSIRFEFVMPEYQEKQAVEYCCYLENHDKQWINDLPGNAKEYTQLHRGSYVFHVKAYNKQKGTTDEATVHFLILPPWYATHWAFACYAVILGILIWLGVLAINQKANRKAQHVKIEKERQLKEQQELFRAREKEKEEEIHELKQQQLEYELKHKSQELADSTMNLIRKNEILTDIAGDITDISEEIKQNEGITIPYKKLQLILENIRENITHDSDWQRFEQHFDLAYDNYLKRLSQEFPHLNISDKKLCAYLKMNLSSKEIAPLLNLSVRSVETARYRLRKKLNLNRDANLTEFLQRF